MKLLATLSSLLAVAAAAVLQSQKASYHGTKVFRVSVGHQADRLNEIVADLGLSTWKGAPRAGALADVVVPADQVREFSNRIAGLESTTMHEDLGAAMAEEANFAAYTGSANLTWFDSFHAYEDHVQFLGDLQKAYPNNSEMVSSGRSLDGRPIQGIHLFGKAGKGARPAVVFHGTVHAREWISTMVVEYMAWHLLSSYGDASTAAGAELRAFVDKYDFYMFPIVNPDGFVFTQSTDRLWRKNRQSSTNSSCIGRDINRNWPHEWAVVGGASKDPCAQDFKGTEEGDAPETVALARWLQQVKDAQGLKLFIDYHSYSQMFMTPYGWTCGRDPDRNDELQALASGVTDAIEAVYGTVFQAGPICAMLYKATGNSVDYVNDVIKADYVFTSELRDVGNFGFILPAAQIRPSGEEAFAGVRYLLMNMK